MHQTTSFSAQTSLPVPRESLTLLPARDVLAVPAMAALARIDDVSFSCDLGGVEIEAAAALECAGYELALVDGLAADIAGLAAAPADATCRQRVAIRLEVIETDACRRFHADYVTLRLLCTYVGPGTLRLGEADAAAVRAGADPETLDPRQLRTGEAALLIGRLLSPDRATLHRSPPIAGTGQRRLVLAIDPAGDIAPTTH